MALHSDGVDAETACLEVLDELHIGVTTARYVHTIVVEV